MQSFHLQIKICLLLAFQSLCLLALATPPSTTAKEMVIVDTLVLLPTAKGKFPTSQRGFLC